MIIDAREVDGDATLDAIIFSEDGSVCSYDEDSFQIESGEDSVVISYGALKHLIKALTILEEHVIYEQ